MQLNNDCIRDIMLYIEANTNPSNLIIMVTPLLKELNKYDEDTLYYHILQISNAGFIKPARAKAEMISDLTWNGHQYLDNIRDDKVWNVLKDKASKLSSVSLQVLVQLAPTIVQSFLK